KEFLPVQGWIRTTEVTRSSDGSAHPHFHTLMMAPPGMLNGKSYVRHER
ncbi:replication protein, partial [Shigella boydii]